MSIKFIRVLSNGFVKRKYKAIYILVQCATVGGTRDGEPIMMSRKAEYAVNNSTGNYHVEATVPLLQQRRLKCEKNEKNTAERPLSSTISLTTRCEENANIANVIGKIKNPAVIDCSNSSGPDIVMSTAVPMKIAGMKHCSTINVFNKIFIFVNIITH